ncbi:hypothetical protein [Mycobacteroides abscessus]|uniref:hypothetical protein n=1 Tax=Mycobacteroides abscessus TaxID=36809 RepID=UPI00177EE069|nr:hypothetical protein [Mycobacteroides abscessus]QOF33714.1 hypothetical protein E3G57_002622 [Mycobacteroides abscessus]
MKFSVGPLAVALVTVSGIAVFPAIGSAEPEPPTADIPLTVEIDSDATVTLSARSPELANTPVEIGFSYHPVDATT